MKKYERLKWMCQCHQNMACIIKTPVNASLSRWSPDSNYVVKSKIKK